MINELGPCIVEWNMDSVLVEIVTLTFMAVEEAPKDKLSILIRSHLKNFDARQYLEVSLTYSKKIKVKEIPFFISFMKQIENPELSTLFIRTMLESERNKKLNTMIVRPVQVLGKRKNKEFYFGGFAYWDLITIK